MTIPQTISAIVDDLIEHRLGEGDLEYLRSVSLNVVLGLHHSLGMMIRNHYELWHTHPLTEKWRTDESSHDIRDGVDYSDDHPDSISSKILEALWQRLHKGRT